MGVRKLRIALTQSEGKLVALEQGLLEGGFEVIRAPLIETKPLVSKEVKGACPGTSHMLLAAFHKSECR